MESVSIKNLFDRLAIRGSGAYGLSAVTQLEHALQSAALAAELELGDEMIIAALFHDVGHLVVEQDIDLASQGIDDRHEEASASVLQPLFGERVSEPVRLHVASKRYLCSTESDYYAKLAEDSRISLKLQGGLMSATEQAEFESNPHYKMGLELRRIDDKAKVPERKIPPIEHYRATALKLASQGVITR